MPTFRMQIILINLTHIHDFPPLVKGTFLKNYYLIFLSLARFSFCEYNVAKVFTCKLLLSCGGKLTNDMQRKFRNLVKLLYQRIDI